MARKRNKNSGGSSTTINDNSGQSMTNFFGPVKFSSDSQDGGESVFMWFFKLVITTIVDLFKILFINVFGLVFSMIAFIPNRIVPKVIDILSETLTGKLILLYLGIFFFGLSLMMTDMALGWSISLLNFFNYSGPYLTMIKSCSNAIQQVLVSIVYLGQSAPSENLSSQMWDQIFQNYKATEIGIGLVVAELAGRWAKDLDSEGKFNITGEHVQKAFGHLKDTFAKKNP